MCLSPITIPTDDGRGRQVPCGRCNACLMRSRAEWAFRVRNEWRASDYAYFVTITYDNLNLPIAELLDEESGAYFYAGIVHKKDVQMFIHYLRKKFPPNTLRYYAISEYGAKGGRSHYHLILFFKGAGDVDQEDLLCKVKSIWKSPEVTVGPLDEGGVLYATTYCFDRWQIDPALPPNFRLMSRNPGIGYSYVDSHKEFHQSGQKFVAYDNGFVNLPRYYREKIFTKEQIEEHNQEIALQLQKGIMQNASLSDREQEHRRVLQGQQRLDYIRQTNKTIFKKKNKSHF